MGILGAFILLYIFTIVLKAAQVYIDMEKGETLEEYVDRLGINELSAYFILHVLYNKFKHFRK